MSDTPYMQHSALAKAADAPSLTYLLAELLRHVESRVQLRVWGAAPKAQTMAQADINRTERAVLDLVRGLRDERGDARLATHVLVNVPGQQTDVARYYCDECARSASLGRGGSDVRRRRSAHRGTD